MAGLVVRPRAHILKGHDWVYASEVLKVFGSPADGDVISIKDGRDRLLGTAIYNSKSQIVARRISRRRQGLDRDFFDRRIALARALRERSGCRPDLHRMVWSESDGLPGVIIDRYGPTAVLQTLTLAMDRVKSVIAESLMTIDGIAGVIERNDAPVRALEGLDLLTGVLAGEPLTKNTFEINGVLFDVDLLEGQKTGFYLDQVDNYALVAAHSAGRSVLDCFANQGGFALSCARAGASTVVAIESGAESFARLKANAARNNLSIQCERTDVFDYLKRTERSEAGFDLIILDPPSFAKGKGTVRDALRGYRELHLRAAGLLQPGGLLATFSCSHHVSESDFLESIREGLHDARRSARLIRSFTQPADHPFVLNLPETAYLKGHLLEIIPAR